VGLAGAGTVTMASGVGCAGWADDDRGWGR
jgi:hypothetical protein